VDERDIVETTYCCGAVSVPAQSVIIRHASKGRSSNVIDGTW
jgi:hypothetical protein